MNWYALKELMSNPLWWVIPVLIIASWMVNHRDPNASKSESKPEKAEKKSQEPPPSEETPSDK